MSAVYCEDCGDVVNDPATLANFWTERVYWRGCVECCLVRMITAPWEHRFFPAR